MNKLNKMVVDAMVKALEEGDAHEGANDEIEFALEFVKDIDFSKVKIAISEWKSIDACEMGDMDEMNDMEVDVNGLCDYLNANGGKVCLDVEGWYKDENKNEVEMSFIAI